MLLTVTSTTVHVFWWGNPEYPEKVTSTEKGRGLELGAFLLWDDSANLYANVQPFAVQYTVNIYLP